MSSGRQGSKVVLPLLGVWHCTPYWSMTDMAFAVGGELSTAQLDGVQVLPVCRYQMPRPQMYGHYVRVVAYFTTHHGQTSAHWPDV